jgi:hypothetical protein
MVAPAAKDGPEWAATATAAATVASVAAAAAVSSRLGTAEDDGTDIGVSLMKSIGRQTAAIVHCRLVLESGAHSFTGAPTVLTPPLSRAVPVPRLMIW